MEKKDVEYITLLREAIDNLYRLQFMSHSFSKDSLIGGTIREQGPDLILMTAQLHGFHSALELAGAIEGYAEAKAGMAAATIAMDVSS